ncbi:hypothetical protein OAM69_01880 [bacterium]|nr:hypothetical protein [bacterium]
MTELDDRLREHFSNVALDGDALARIHGMANDAEALGLIETPSPEVASPMVWLQRLRKQLFGQRSAEGHGATRFGPLLLRYASFAVLVLVVGVSMHLTGSIDERGDSAIREVAMNHTTRLSFEFEGHSLAELDSHMNQLPFELAAPSHLPDNAKVLGSRYCTLSGQLAAHVKMRDGITGRPLSLFVTSSAAELNRLRGENGYIDGLDVELFSEGGLFYALVQQAG